MKKSLKRMLPVLMAGCMVFSMTGCGGEEDTAAEGSKTENTSQTGGSGEIVLNVWHQWANDTNELKKKYDEAVEVYMAENPGVVIHSETLDTEAYKTKISAEFAGEAKGIDVFYYWGAGTAQKLVDSGKLLPIDEYVTDEVRSKIVDGSTAAFEYDGKLYSLPSFSWYMTLFCNQELFDQAGAAIPTNYKEFVEAVQKLSVLDGVTPLASGAKDGWNAAFIYQALALREVGAEGVNRMLRGEVEFGEEGYREAAQKVVDLYNMGAFGENPLEQSNDEANGEFNTGKAAMRLTGSWYANALYTDSNTTIDLERVVAVKIPMISGKGNETDYCGGFVESFWVNGNTEYPAEAAKFAIYINEKMGVGAYETGSGLSGWNVEVDESNLNPLFLEIKDIFVEGKTGVLAWDTSLESEPAAIHNEAVQMLFDSGADVDKFMEQNKEAINR